MVRLALASVLLAGCVAGRRADGDRYLAEARYPAAARAYGDVLERRPQDERALLGQARAQLAAGRPEQALAPAEHAHKRGLPEGTALYAEALIEVGRAAEALPLLSEPETVPGGQRLRAEALLSTGDISGALDAALETPDRGLLAWCALRSGDRAAAQAAAEASLLDPPADPRARAEVAGVLLSLGVEVEVEIPDASVSRWWSAAARRQAAGDLEGTLRLLSRIVVSRPRESRYSSALGLLWLQAGEPALARRALEDALSTDGAQPEVWVALALACTALGQHECAAVAYEGRLELEPPLADNWSLAAGAWEKADQPARAVALLQRAVGAEPERWEHPFRMAKAYRATDDVYMAIGYAERAWALAPEQPEPVLLLGELLLWRGDKQAAAQVYAAGMAAHPDDPRFEAGRRAALGYVP